MKETAVIVLLLLADLLNDYQGNKLIEIVAFNGEDYYAVPGQMNYIAANQNNFSQILLNINIDGAGYKEGSSAFSLFSLHDQPLSPVIANNTSYIIGYLSSSLR